MQPLPSADIFPPASTVSVLNVTSAIAPVALLPERLIVPVDVTWNVDAVQSYGVVEALKVFDELTVTVPSTVESSSPAPPSVIGHDEGDGDVTFSVPLAPSFAASGPVPPAATPAATSPESRQPPDVSVVYSTATRPPAPPPPSAEELSPPAPPAAVNVPVEHEYVPTARCTE